MPDSINNLLRPRMGAANVGYDMDAARQYPQPSADNMASLAMLATPYAPMGAGAAAYLGMRALGQSIYPSTGGGRVIPALTGVQAGVLTDEMMKALGLYRDPRDAESQPGGFYGPPVNNLLKGY